VEPSFVRQYAASRVAEAGEEASEEEDSELLALQAALANSDGGDGGDPFAVSEALLSAAHRKCRKDAGAAGQRLAAAAKERLELEAMLHAMRSGGSSNGGGGGSGGVVVAVAASPIAEGSSEDDYGGEEEEEAGSDDEGSGGASAGPQARKRAPSPILVRAPRAAVKVSPLQSPPRAPGPPRAALPAVPGASTAAAAPAGTATTTTAATAASAATASPDKRAVAASVEALLRPSVSVLLGHQGSSSGPHSVDATHAWPPGNSSSKNSGNSGSGSRSGSKSSRTKRTKGTASGAPSSSSSTASASRLLGVVSGPGSAPAGSGATTPSLAHSDADVGLTLQLYSYRF
jgi:hypothetical protein